LIQGVPCYGEVAKGIDDARKDIAAGLKRDWNTTGLRDLTS
jgi:hypothetical protein